MNFLGKQAIKKLPSLFFAEEESSAAGVLWN